MPTQTTAQGAEQIPVWTRVQVSSRSPLRDTNVRFFSTVSRSDIHNKTTRLFQTLRAHSSCQNCVCRACSSQEKEGLSVLISDPRKHSTCLGKNKVTCQELKLNRGFLLLQTVIQTHMLRASLPKPRSYHQLQPRTKATNCRNTGKKGSK